MIRSVHFFSHVWSLLSNSSTLSLKLTNSSWAEAVKLEFRFIFGPPPLQTSVKACYRFGVWEPVLPITFSNQTRDTVLTLLSMGSNLSGPHLPFRHIYYTNTPKILVLLIHFDNENLFFLPPMAIKLTKPQLSSFQK